MSYVNAIVGEFMGMNGKTITPQYQAPKKPWVGLTKEEFIHYSSFCHHDVLDEIEKLLKEKNHG
jgi:hypothetical protein